MNGLTQKQVEREANDHAHNLHKLARMMAEQLAHNAREGTQVPTAADILKTAYAHAKLWQSI
jgi:hypothetical protein